MEPNVGEIRLGLDAASPQNQRSCGSRLTHEAKEHRTCQFTIKVATGRRPGAAGRR